MWCISALKIDVCFIWRQLVLRNACVDGEVVGAAAARRQHLVYTPATLPSTRMMTNTLLPY